MISACVSEMRRNAKINDIIITCYYLFFFFWVLKFKIRSPRKTNHSWFSKSALNNRPFIINIFTQTSNFVHFITNNAPLTLLLHLLNWAYLLKTTQSVIILKSKNYIFYDSDYPYWGFFTELIHAGYLCAQKKTALSCWYMQFLFLT